MSVNDVLLHLQQSDTGQVIGTETINHLWNDIEGKSGNRGRGQRGEVAFLGRKGRHRMTPAISNVKKRMLTQGYKYLPHQNILNNDGNPFITSRSKFSTKQRYV